MEKEKVQYCFDISKSVYQKEPKVSVIIPVYKVERYLIECINSVLNQTLEELEVIIVDEGEQDKCREIIDFFERKDPRIVAPHQKNGGYGASCNLWISMARGEYISIIESDDWIEPEMYEEMYAYAKRLGADVVKTPYYEYRSDGSKNECHYRTFMREHTPRNVCFSVKEYGELLEVHASLWSGLYRTTYLKEKGIKFIRAKGGAYVDVGFRIDTLVNTDKIAWLDKPYYNYRIDAVGSSTNNFKLSTMLQRWKEVHEKFEDTQIDYDKWYGQHLILDEYLNSVGWLWLIPASDEEYKQISYNLSFVKEDTIEKSQILNSRQKKELLEYKSSPAQFKRRVNQYRKMVKIKYIIEKILNRLSDPFLLLWILAGFITSFVVSMANKIDANFLMFSPIFYKIFDIFMFLSFFGIIACFAGKLLRKLYNKALQVYYEEKKKEEFVQC